MNLALAQNFIKITNNDHLVVLIIKVVYSNRSYEENQKITQSLINQRYRVFDLFLYD